jgi:Helix-turn-helix domain
VPAQKPLPAYVPRARVQGEDRQRCGTRAAELYGEGKSIRRVAAELGGWSYGATHRLLTEFKVQLRGRGMASRR